MPAIHQFTAGFSSGDAISNEALLMRDIFRSWGCDAGIFTSPSHNQSEIRRHAGDAADYASRAAAGDVALLHFSIGSRINALFPELPCRKALLYHNVTPSHYYDMVNPEIARDLSRGRSQLEALAGVPELTMADSQFNADELAELGFPDVRVLPLIIDFNRLTAAPDARTLKLFDDGAVNVLFVGRCAPNKKIEDVIETFAAFHRHVEPASRLILVGSATGTERYHGALLGTVHDLQIADAVHFAGPVSMPALIAFYRCADIFLCMSEHEGFCIPLMEAMLHDVPVMACAAGAVPETMDGAGILLLTRDPGPIAEMMGRVVRNTAFRNALLEGQRKRLARFRARNLAAELKQHLQPLLPK